MSFDRPPFTEQRENSQTGDHERMAEPLGKFRAVVTRDASAQDRDGQSYYDINRLSETLPEFDTDRIAELNRRGGELFEVQFSDGEWMLARGRDLV